MVSLRERIGSFEFPSVLLWSFFAVWLAFSIGCGGGDDEAVTDETDPETGQVLTVPEPPVPETISVNLSAGDQFPLLKTITQTLTVATDQGPKESRSTLKMWLALKVERQDADGSKYISVRYDRVVYTRDLAGELLQYDSKQPEPTDLPMEVRIHAGVVNNGFAFRLDPANGVRDVVGFDNFLERCVRKLPEPKRSQVLRHLRASSGSDGVIDFVDDSIGLLPFQEGGLAIGSIWERERTVRAPMPMHIQKEYHLSRLTDRFAEISVRGSITPDVEDAVGANGHRTRLLRGQVVGNCRIDRITGIPEEAELQRILELSVALPDGRAFSQKKIITSRIETFLPTPGQEPLRIGGGTASRREIGSPATN